MRLPRCFQHDLLLIFRRREYGEYLANTCKGCHGAGFSGGPIPGIPAQPPYPANLTADVATGLGSWQEADFVTALRTGIRPDGTLITSAMPWQTFQGLTDDELDALWLYLQSVRPRLREIARRSHW